MKYQKPYAHDLSELSFADGACSSGHFVGTCFDLAGGTAGRCWGDGHNAGKCDTNGGSPTGTACTANGDIANDCVSYGNYASRVL